MKSHLLFVFFNALLLTAYGQQPVLLRNCGPAQLDAYTTFVGHHPDGRFLFSAFVGFTPQYDEIHATFISDGTPNGTVFLGYEQGIESVPLGTNGSILRCGDGSIHVTDGTHAGTYQLHPDSALVSFGKMCGLDGKVFFIAETPASGAEMWVTDGTASGTHLIKDIRPGPGSAIRPNFFSMPYVGMVHPISLDGQRLIFLAQDNPVAPQFWSTDGTDAGTYKISMIDSAGYGLYLKWSMNSAVPNYLACSQRQAVHRYHPQRYGRHRTVAARRDARR